MSNQPQQPYYDPYGQQPPQGQPYDPNAAQYGHDPYQQQPPQPPQDRNGQAQTWQGQTWESQSHPTIHPDPAQGSYGGQPYGGQQGYPAQGHHSQGHPAQGCGAQPSGQYPGPAAPSPYEETALMPPTPAAGPPPAPPAPPGAPGRPAPSPYEETAMMPQATSGGTPTGPPPPGMPSYGGQGRPVPPPSPYEETALIPPTSAGQPSPYEETALIPPVTGAGPAPYEETALIPPVTGAGPMPAAQPQPHPQPQGGHRAPAGTGSHRAAPAAEEPAADGPAYGPATVTGNTRITDAQRARAEGRSPIIDPGTQPALLTAALGLLMAGGAALGWFGLLVPLVVLQGLTAAGWFRLNGMWPARQGIALAFAGALVADAVLLVAGRENGPAAVVGTLGVWVLLCLVLQLRSNAPADDRLHGLFATVASAALAILAAGYLAAEADAVVVGGISVAVAVFVRSLPLPAAASMAVAVLAGAGAGAVGGALTGLGTQAALIGAGAAVCAVIGHRVAAYDYPSRFVHMTAGVALPLTAAVPAVYLLGRVVTG
ncbi:hypothetical protein [Streptomyces sp. FT1]|uniref:hypothetical protein n=1 Tax=Streptomyces sp. FT1 TaxID=2871486 RepID=UPI0022538C97|nr:hypothetical protein [Streptomyces sp. FT1]MCX5461735.1 hypothetical protein [Streptomyces sp. FT1]